MSEASGGFIGPLGDESAPMMVDPARCLYCLGSVQGITLDTLAANAAAGRCHCGSRRLAWLGNGYVLVHREGCDGTRCGCWGPAGGLGEGAAMVTPTGRRRTRDG